MVIQQPPTTEDTLDVFRPADETRMQQIAWGVVWVAFAFFCMLCTSTTVGVYYFFFNSQISLDALVQVGRGTALVQTSDVERGVRSQDVLSNTAQISTDLQSQATLVFMVNSGSANPRFVAAITLKNNSLITLRRATYPRFDWSNGRYELELTNFDGEIEVVVAEGLDRPILLQIYTRRDELIYINRTGRYSINASSTRVQVINRLGEVVLFAPNRTDNLLIPSGQDGVLYAGRKPVNSLPRANLLENSLFVFDTFDDTTDNIESALPGRWGCANVQADLPRGLFEADVWQGRAALRLLRAENASTNGETRCKQPFATPGRDVRDYNYLEVETSFLVNYQSLSQCGVEGSECPLMLHMEYVDSSGVPREWYQGFYYALDPTFSFYKPRCASCLQDHIQINEKVWYTYETGNLFTILPAELRPAFITNIEFYASGHQYDVFVSEIGLFAGFAEAVPPNNPPANGN